VRNQKGFTLVELIAVIWVLFMLSMLGGFIYAVCHFAAKFW